MKQLAYGRKTVPQIFFNEQHIGGSAELLALDKMKRLDEDMPLQYYIHYLYVHNFMHITGIQ